MLRDYDTAKYIVLLFFSMNYNVLNLQYNIRIMMDVSGISTWNQQVSLHLIDKSIIIMII
jgi:hypothetical protein